MRAAMSGLHSSHDVAGQPPDFWRDRFGGSLQDEIAGAINRLRSIERVKLVLDLGILKYWTAQQRQTH